MVGMLYVPDKLAMIKPTLHVLLNSDTISIGALSIDSVM